MIVEYSFIIAVIPVILVVAFLVWIAKKITDGERLDMKEGVLGVVILMVAVLIMVPMISSTQVYTWDDDTGELVIQQNISGGSYAWDTYDSQIRSIVIKPGVTQIGNSAFDGATNLEYLSIPESVADIGTNAFGVTIKDYLDQTITEPEAGEYVGTGDGTLYFCDGSIFTYSTNGTTISGLTADAATAINLVFPSKNGNTTVTAIGASAFENKATVERAMFLPDSTIASLGASVFKGTGLLAITLPDSIAAIPTNMFQNCADLVSVDGDTIRTIGQNAFNGCGSLAAYAFPSSLTSIGYNSFYGCTSLTSLELPEGLTSIGPRAFQGCTGVTTVHMPASIVQIDANAFNGCTGVTSVVFASGFSPTSFDSTWAPSWSFYASDGTTQIDKSVASNLAGKTFQGTAAALVEVEPGRLALTPQQIQQVHLHDTELQDLKDQISIDPLPLQPSLQEQELTA